MTVLTPERLAEIAGRAEKATPGPWESDSMKSDGSYGVGDETYEGFNAFKVTDEKGNTVCDTLNSDMGEVHVEYDEDGATAWDEIGRRNADFIAHARADIPDLLASHAALVERTRLYDAALERMAEYARDNTTLQAEVERWRDRAKAAEAHVREAEAACGQLQDRPITARESTAHEMRERCAAHIALAAHEASKNNASLSYVGLLGLASELRALSLEAS